MMIMIIMTIMMYYDDYDYYDYYDVLRCITNRPYRQICPEAEDSLRS